MSTADSNYQPLVSVIINTRNDVEFLRAAIDSVYAQTYSHFEIIVYDNNSTADIKAELQGYDDRLRYERSDESLTLGAARNAAIEKATGELIDFLDADDLFAPEKLGKQVALFSDPAVGLVFSSSEHFTVQNDCEAVIDTVTARPVDGNIFDDLLADYFISWDSAMFRRSAIGNNPEDWFNPVFDICTDYDLFLRIAHREKVISISDTLSRWRLHDSNRSRQLTAREPVEKLMMLSRILDYEPRLYQNHRKALRRYLTKVHLALGNYYWSQGFKSAAWSSTWNAFSLTLNLSALVKLFLIPLTDYEDGIKFKRGV